MEQKLLDAASRLPETNLSFDAIQPVPKGNAVSKAWRTAAALAACIALLISVGFGTYAYAAEVREYNDAVKFFNDYGLSTEGLTRGEIKAVYRDITTKSFTYSKTAEVIEGSLSTEQIGGYEILQENPTPEDVENLWNYKNFTGGFVGTSQEGIRYECRTEYQEDGLQGLILEKNYFEKYDGDTLLWSIPVSGSWIGGYSIVSDGIIIYGNNDYTNHNYAWMEKIDANGNFLWKHMMINGFEDEYIAAVLENDDGSYAVISRGDLKYFCLSQYTPDGKEIYFHKTEIGNYGIWNAARFGDGYIVQLGSFTENGHSRIAMVDREGNITESFSYGSEDACYFITDMIEFDGNIYLSAYAVPKLADEDPRAGGIDYEIAAVLDYVFDNGLFEISSEELTPLVRDNYTAILLVCDPGVGTPQEFYSVKGSLGGELCLSDSGDLQWDVESITTTFFSLATNSFTIGGTSYVYRYTFDHSGVLVSQEKTGEVINYRR